MKRLIVAALLIAGRAYAQPIQGQGVNANLSLWDTSTNQWRAATGNSSGALNVTGTFTATSQTLTWQANLTVSAATSTAFSSATTNDGTLPGNAAALTYLVAINQGANPVTVCFQGGTCSATTGVIIPAGGFKANALPGTALPSFYSTSGTIVSLSNG